MGKNVVNRAINRRILVGIYIFSMTIAFTTRYGDLQLGNRLQLLISVIWIFFGFLNVALNGSRIRRWFALYGKWFMNLYLFPRIMVHLYTMLLMAMGKVSWSYFTTNATVYIPALFSIISLCIFGVRALKYNIIALICSWFLSVSTSVLMQGFRIFPYAIVQGYIDPIAASESLSVNYLELHDVVLAMGYLAVYYIFTNCKLTRKKMVMFLAIILVMGLGIKRISILALFLVLLFHIVLKWFDEKRQLKFCCVAAWIGFVLCYLFIYILSKGNAFYDFIGRYGINAMGRNYYFQAIMEYARFSPTFLGIGRNVVTQILNTELSYLRVGGVHSDIIKMYVENGFVLFGIWLWYYLIYIMNKYKTQFGNKAAIFYFETVIYTFSLYVTDNIEIYFICQILGILVPATYGLKNYFLQEELERIVLWEES